ncbi:MAG TPA: hypothetical protein VGN83_20365 [Falsiroseomonas sp.]|jgi:hypothetical protein|nr:hypothetical protein [Falsiroseomonas sp.]
MTSPHDKRRIASPRLTLRDDLRDADGQPRPCLTWPGRGLPVAFPSVSAALAALARMEAGHDGR